MFQNLTLFWVGLVVCLGLAATGVQSDGKYVPEIDPNTNEPPCAKGKNYCEGYLTKYPKEEILKILKGLHDLPSELISFISDDNTDEPNNEYVNKPNSAFNISQNFFIEESDDQLCRYSTHFIYPVVVKNQHDEWRYIVNLKKADFLQMKIRKTTYQQRVEIQECKPGRRMCSMTGHAECQQINRTIKLLALHPSGTKFYTENFSVPSCCQCQLV